MALQLSKVGASLPLLREEFGLSLTQGGILFGAMPLGTAMLGALGGQLFGRLGIRRTGVISMTLLAIGSLGGMWVDQFATLLAWRLVESLGYLTGIIAMPGLIAANAGKSRNTAMGLWSSFVPAGFTLMLLASGPLIALAGWRGLWFLAGIIPIIIGILLLVLLPKDQPHDGTRVIDFTNLRHCLCNPVAWAVAMCFLLFSLVFLSVTHFLPEYLYTTTGYDLGNINVLIGIAIFLSALSNLFGGWLFNYRSVRFCANSTMLAMLVCTVPLFAPGMHEYVRFAGMFLFAALSGMLPGAFWAYMPSTEISARHTAALTGMVMQLSACGQFIGPTLVGFAIDTSGTWSVVIGVTLLFTLAVLIISRWLPSNIYT